MNTAPEISARRAAWIGWAWVNGSVLAGYVFGFGLLVLLFNTKPVFVDALGLWFLLLILLVLVAPWFLWSFQVTRWRLWAYRRVRDVNALKAEAMARSVIWPSGHLIEKTEFRTLKQKLELDRLERERV
ncbi:hypothetical protein D3C86_1678970 [compost metagenome]|jgi:hypothetical protein